MAPDPLDTLRLPIVPVSPRAAFAAELRRRVADDLGRSQVPEESEAVMAVDLNRIPSVTPVLHYHDPEAALVWLGETLGLTESWANRAADGTLENAEVRWRAGFVSINLARGPYEARHASIWLTVPDRSEVDALHGRAVAAGANITVPLGESGYGFYTFTAVDPEGNTWMVGTEGGLTELRRSKPGPDNRRRP
jgi:uncharacterized glyoxalase superfamily protein PhnB